MVSIRSLLDTFGPPPREICLDWAWQINAAAVSPTVASAAPEPREVTPQDSSGDADWTSVEVADDGQLRLERLSAAMAWQATVELREWFTVDAAGDRQIAADVPSTSDRESDSRAETFGPGDTLSRSVSDCGRSRPSASRKRGPPSLSFFIKARRRHLTLAGVLLAALGTLMISLWGRRYGSMPVDAEVSAGATAATDIAPARGDSSQDAALGEDDWPGQDGGALASGWTTSAELTAGALEEPTTQLEIPAATGVDLAMQLSPSPSLSKEPSKSAAKVPNAVSNSIEANGLSTAALPSEPDLRSADPMASPAVDDVLSQVAAAAQQAEMQIVDESTDAASDSPVDDGVAAESSMAEEDWARQPALMLAREANVIRPAFPRGLARRLREPHWTARIEIADGFLCEPAAAQTLAARASAQWRIYDKDAKSPRACLIVSVRRRNGRDPGLEWSLRGGAEDLPELHLPVERKWLDALSTQLKVSATSLRALVDTPTQSAPRELRSLIQNQRQLARRQLELAERLVGLLAELDRMASLLDDELLCHAELRESEGGPVLLAYGSSEDAPAQTLDQSEASAK